MLLFYIFKRVPKVYPKFYHFTRNLVCSESYLSNIGVLLQHILLPFPCIPLLFPSLDRYLECSFWKLSSSPSSTSSSTIIKIKIILFLATPFFSHSYTDTFDVPFANPVRAISATLFYFLVCAIASHPAHLQHHSHHHQHHYQNHHSHHVIFSIIVFTRPMLFFSCLPT